MKNSGHPPRLFPCGVNYVMYLTERLVTTHTSTVSGTLEPCWTRCWPGGWPPRRVLHTPAPCWTHMLTPSSTDILNRWPLLQGAMCTRVFPLMREVSRRALEECETRCGASGTHWIGAGPKPSYRVVPTLVCVCTALMWVCRTLLRVCKIFLMTWSSTDTGGDMHAHLPLAGGVPRRGSRMRGVQCVPVRRRQIRGIFLSIYLPIFLSIYLYIYIYIYINPSIYIDIHMYMGICMGTYTCILYLLYIYIYIYIYTYTYIICVHRHMYV